MTKTSSPISLKERIPGSHDNHIILQNALRAQKSLNARYIAVSLCIAAAVAWGSTAHLDKTAVWQGAMQASKSSDVCICVHHSQAGQIKPGQMAAIRLHSSSGAGGGVLHTTVRSADIDEALGPCKHPAYRVCLKGNHSGPTPIGAFDENDEAYARVSITVGTRPALSVIFKSLAEGSAIP